MRKSDMCRSANSTGIDHWNRFENLARFNFHNRFSTRYLMFYILNTGRTLSGRLEPKKILPRWVWVFDCLTLKNIIFILKEKCSWYHFSTFVYYLCKINNYLYHKKTIKKFVNEKNVSVSNILWCTHLSKIESAYNPQELLILFHFLALTNKKQTSFSPTI